MALPAALTLSSLRLRFNVVAVGIVRLSVMAKVVPARLPPLLLTVRLVSALSVMVLGQGKSASG